MAHAKKAAHRKKSGRGNRSKITGGGRRSSAVRRRSFTLPPTVSKSELLDANGKSDRDFRQFLYDFSVLGAHLDRARAYLASQLGLSAPRYNIVMIVAQYQKKTGVSVSEVAQHLHVTTAFITSEAGKLENAGWINKLPNPNDGRGVLLRLTPFGESKVLELGPRRLLVNNHLFRSLSGDDFHHLVRTFASLIDDFSETAHMLTLDI